MFPATGGDESVQKSGWLSRILASEQRQLLLPSQQQASSSQPQRRAFTPLRPNAGMATRLAETDGGAGRPALQRGSSHRSSASHAAAPPTASNSARAISKLPPLPTAGGAKASAGGSVAASSITPLTSGRDTLPNRCDSTDTRAGVDIPGPLAANPSDEFSNHEHDVLLELNVFRNDPALYAETVNEHLRVGEPFVQQPSEPSALRHPPMTLAELTAHRDSLSRSLVAATARAASIDHDEKQQLRALQEQWAAEDVERAKKKGKGGGAAAAKKEKDQLKQSTLSAGGDATEEERDKQRQAVQRRAQTDRDAVAAESAELQSALAKANDGVHVVGLLLAKLRATPQLPELEHNRGLSLAARDLAAGWDGSPTVDISQYTARYGEGDGPYGHAGALGLLSARNTVLDLLLSLNDKGKRRGRYALLSPLMRVVGCGWRKHPSSEHRACTSVIIAGHFGEFAAIAMRPHLPLFDVRRALAAGSEPRAVSTTATAAGSATSHAQATTVRLAVPPAAGIDVIHPTSHPATTSIKKFVALVRCPADMTVCAVVLEDSEEEPSKPSFVTANAFVQRSPNPYVVEVHAAFPGDGLYKVILYGELPAALAKVSGMEATTFSLNATAAFTPRLAATTTMQQQLGGTMQAASSSVDNLALEPETLYRRVGAVFVRVAGSDPRLPAPAYPTVSADFTERRCRVVSPLSGLLRPNTVYNFKLVVPLSQYKAVELGRVERSLAAAEKRAAKSHGVMDKLQVQLAEADAEIAAAESAEQGNMPALQQELTAVQKDLSKKKGKELDKAKALIADVETKIEVLTKATEQARAKRQRVEETLSRHRRSALSAASMCRRYAADQAQLLALTDRSKPLDVSISVDDRMAPFACVANDGTEYELRLRTPAEGRVTVFLAGVAAVSYSIDQDAIDWPDAAFDDAPMPPIPALT